MDITQTPCHDTRPGWEWLYRTLPKSKVNEAFRCRECGIEVEWHISKKGYTYLAQKASWSIDSDGSHDGSSHHKSWYPKHDCQPDPEWQAQYRSAMAAIEAKASEDLAAGGLVKGQTIVVVKGRKVPKGTTGVIFWVATEEDAYGVIKVGFKTAEGDKHYTNIANIEVAK